MKENNTSQDAFYSKFKTQLETTMHFPSIYTYKFIVPNSTDASARIKEIFDATGAVISARPSARGTYSSITISVMMESADDVIDKYRKAAEIDGVVML